MALYRCSSGGGSEILSVSDAGDILTVPSKNRKFVKQYSGLTYVRVCRGRMDNGKFYFGIFLVSKIRNAVIYTYSEKPYSSHGPWYSDEIRSVTFNGETWYYNGNSYGYDLSSLSELMAITTEPTTLNHIAYYPFYGGTDVYYTIKEYIAYDTLQYLKYTKLI